MLSNLEDGPQTSESVVSGRETAEAILHACLVVLVKENKSSLTTLNIVVDALANNGGRIDDIVEERFIDSTKSTTIRADGAVATALLAGLRECAALANDHDLGARELLLELWNEVALDLVIGVHLFVWDREDEDLLAVRGSLLDASDFEVSEGLLHAFLGGCSDLAQCCCNFLLESSGFTLLINAVHSPKGQAKPP